jgi:hypothetical protein
MPGKATRKKKTVKRPIAKKDEVTQPTAKDEVMQSVGTQPVPGDELIGSVVIDLQEGFMDDTVAIRVGDREIFHQENVSTDFLLGVAGSVEARVPQGPVTVEVSVPSRRLFDVIKLDASPNAHLGVALREQQLQFRISDQSFTYF